MYKDGDCGDIAIDYEKAIYWYSKLAEQGDSDYYYELGEIYELKRDYEKAIYWYSKLAKNGIVYSYVELGKIYKLKKDYKKVIDCYMLLKQEFEKGNALLFSKMVIADIYIQLGELYEQGLGVEKDINKALEYYKRSAEQGNKEAKCALEILENKG